MHVNAVDISNQRFGRLIAIKPTDKRGGSSVMWECLCDCGKICFVRCTSLRGGMTRSCGCFLRDFHRKEFGLASLNALYNRYKQNSKRRKIYFGLTLEEFKSITQSPCFYCEISPEQSIDESGNGSYIYNGIDRLDGSKGYIIENCVPACKICNYMKRTMSLNDFIGHIKRIYDCCGYLETAKLI